MSSTYSVGLSLAQLGHAPIPGRCSRQDGRVAFCEPPFFASKFRWIDSRTSFKAAAIEQAGRMERASLVVLEFPRTAAESSSTTGSGRIGFQEQAPVTGTTITVTVAVGSSCARLVNASAFCRLSTACSIFRSPRHLCVASEPWRDYQPPTQVWPDRGENGCRSSDAAREENSAAIPVTNASCLSEIQRLTVLFKDVAHSLAWAIKHEPHRLSRRSGVWQTTPASG